MLPQGKSLYDDFAEWRTPTHSDYEEALRRGLVVLDTNVLLDLYRFEAGPRGQLLDALDKISSQLWVPSQVIHEFFRNRDNARRHLRTRSEELLSAMANALKTTDRLFKEWANRAGLPDELAEDLTEARGAGFTDTEARIRQVVADGGTEQTRDTNRDEVLLRIETLLEGRVGPSFSASEYDAAVKEGLARRAREVPPGYKDKTPIQGDYLVWKQMLTEAARRGVPSVLFITRDIKEDWQEIEGGERLGPRHELIKELAETANGSKLLMARGRELERLIQSVLGGPPSEGSSVVAVQRVVEEEMTTSDTAGAAVIPANALWTAEALNELLKRLELTAGVQATAIRRAIESGNSFISREEVYRLGRFAPNRTLRGFTRPVNRITQQLREEGVVAEAAPDPLVAVYDPSISYVQAAGFTVPETLVLY